MQHKIETNLGEKRKVNKEKEKKEKEQQKIHFNTTTGTISHPLGSTRADHNGGYMKDQR